MRVGDRVYDRSVEANGIVTEIDDNNEYAKVEYFWAKYCDTEGGRWTDRNGGHGNKWNRSQVGMLVPASLQPQDPIKNRVSSIGGRSLDRLIRLVCEIRHRQAGDGSTVVICYGQSQHAVPDHIFMVNRRLVMDKMAQCLIMGDDLAPDVWSRIGDVPEALKDKLIVKPFHSLGGRGIHRYNGDPLDYNEYLQLEFHKVREFRAHCFLWLDDPVPFIQEKVIGDRNQLCWNKKQGGKFQYVYQPSLGYGKYNNNISTEIVDKIKEHSVKALRKLKMDFGGLDFGMDKDGNLKIFEVNSRMGLRERSLHTYKDAFSALKVLDLDAYKNSRGW